MKKYLYSTAMFLVGLLMVVLLLPTMPAVWLLPVGTALRFGLLELGLLLLSLVPIGWLSVCVHESGHLLGAKLARLRWVYVQLGPAILWRLNGRPRLGFSSVFWSGGRVGVQSNGISALRPRLAVFYAFAPMANLVVAFTCLALAARFNRAIGEKMLSEQGGVFDIQGISWYFDALDNHGRLGAFFAIAGLLNYYLAVGSMFPGKGGELKYPTDGAFLLELIFDGNRAESRYLLAELTGALLNGIRPRDWSSEVVDRILTLREDSPRDVRANLYGYYFEIDCGNVERAGDLLDRAMAHLLGSPKSGQPGVLVEAAFFEARYRRNPKGRQWLDQIKESTLEAHT
ncbi:MAG TPA: hypothetical protein VE988_30340, partial [Gemmataceae bacterium]|nr:hypothetical protein [Gemmataceae bacterium]